MNGARSRLRAVVPDALLLLWVLAVFWPVRRAWWSGEDLVGLAASRNASFLETLRPDPARFPWYRPLWSALIKLCDTSALAPGAAHLIVVLVHAAALVVLFRAGTRIGVRRAHGWLACALAGTMPGTADCLTWLPAGNRAFAFLCLALQLWWLARWPDQGKRAVVTRAAGLALLQTLALGFGENAYGHVPFLVAILALRPRRRWRDVAVPGLALVVPTLLHVLLSRGAHRHVAPLLALPAEPVRFALDRLARHAAHAFIAPAAAGPWLLLLPGALLAAALWRRRRIAVGCVAAWLLVGSPSVLYVGGTHHAYFPALALGLCAALLPDTLTDSTPAAGTLPTGPLPHERVWRPARTPWLPAMWILAVVLALPANALAARARLQPFREHFGRLAHVVADLRALPSPAPGRVVAVLNLPLEFTVAFDWVHGPGTTEHVRLWTLVTTRASAAAPAAEGPALRPQADAWLEYDGHGLRPATWPEIAARGTAPALWLAQPPPDWRPPDLDYAHLFAAHARLEDLDAPRANAGAGTARLLAHRFRVEGVGVVWEWDVDATLAESCDVVLTYVPGVLPILEFMLLDAFLDLVPPPLRIDVVDLDDGAARSVPVRFVHGWFPALRLPAGRQRLRVVGWFVLQ